MSIFNIKRTPEATKESTGGGNYLSKSGIYDVTIKLASIKVNSFNAREIDFNLDYNGSTTTIYGLKLDNNDGTENYQSDIFNKLCIIADLETVADPEMETHKFGETSKDLAVLPDFTDLPVKVRIQEEFSDYKGEIKRRLVIKNFYRADGATASEIINEVASDAIGKQLEKDKAYADKPAYRAPVTAEAVAIWQEAEATKKSGTKAPAAPRMSASAPAANLFAKK